MENPTSCAFASDTTASVHPSVLEAITRANGNRRSYGGDELSEQVRGQVERLFKQSCHVLFVPSGTGSNVLSVGSLLGRAESALIASTGHMHVDECATVEACLGNRLVPVPTPDGKLTADLLDAALGNPSMLNRPKPTVVSVTQPTELGTVYTNAELRAISYWCHLHKCALHVDGARFANALAHQGCTPSEMFERVDVSALSFGFTKNGGMNGDVVVLMDSRQVTHREDQVKRLQLQLMQLPAKAWAISASVGALLEKDLWLELAATANERAVDLWHTLTNRANPMVTAALPVQTNGIFFKAKPALIGAIRSGYDCYDWRTPDELRLMTSHDTTLSSIATFGEHLQKNLT